MGSSLAVLGYYRVTVGREQMITDSLLEPQGSLATDWLWGWSEGDACKGPGLEPRRRWPGLRGCCVSHAFQQWARPGTKGRLRHSHRSWKGFKLRSKHFPQPATCTKGSVNQHSGNAARPSASDSERDSHAPDQQARCLPGLWRFGSVLIADPLVRLGRKVTVSL